MGLLEGQCKGWLIRRVAYVLAIWYVDPCWWNKNNTSITIFKKKTIVYRVIATFLSVRCTSNQSTSHVQSIHKSLPINPQVTSNQSTSHIQSIHKSPLNCLFIYKMNRIYRSNSNAVMGIGNNHSFSRQQLTIPSE